MKYTLELTQEQIDLLHYAVVAKIVQQNQELRKPDLTETGKELRESIRDDYRNLLCALPDKTDTAK